MKATEARKLSDKSTKVDNIDTILSRIRLAADSGLTSIQVSARLMTVATTQSLRKLGYHLHRCSPSARHERWGHERIIPESTYIIQW